MNIIDGKKVADSILTDLQLKISKNHSKPGLVFILVGEDAPSLAYVNMKVKACAKIDINSHVIRLPKEVSEEALLERINAYNQDRHIDGILVQQPLPRHIDSDKIVSAVLPEKDVDGFHPYNLGKLMLGRSDGFISCTPLGIITLLHHYSIPIEKKHVVILGRSNIVGKPLASLLLLKKPGHNATVTVAHSATVNLKEITLSADILIAAIGKANFVTKDMVKKGAVVVDVGISRVFYSTERPKIVGDVNFEEVADIASYITPVPKGVGPMTITMLMQNTYKSFLNRENRL